MCLLHIYVSLPLSLPPFLSLKIFLPFNNSKMNNPMKKSAKDLNRLSPKMTYK